MSSELITITNPKSPIAEAYRTLRTNIQFSNVDEELKIICVTSSGPSEGKTTTSCNLAETFAQSGKRVLLIDGDLRKPRVHKVFKLSGTKGLTNLLAGQVELEDVVYYVESDLSILPCGPIPPNPSELIASKRMKELLGSLRKKYDLIIVDAPPVGVVTDSAILSTIVDGTLLVVASGKTEIENGKRAKQLLENVNARILGVVMTMIPVTKKGYYGYQYYSYEEEVQFTKNKKFFKKK